jgi:3-oxoacyl-[acyl-carrier protein] reductase
LFIFIDILLHMKVKDKNILIVGASSGIGHALAQLLLHEQARLYTASRNPPMLDGSFQHIPLDVLDLPETLDALPDELHGLVYCPGSILLKPFAALGPESFREELELNVLGAVQLLQLCFKRLRKAEGASVVLFSSVAARQGMNYHTAVGLTKGALEGFGIALAAEWSRLQIRVNLIAPSLTDTPLAARLLNSDDKRKASDLRHPLGRTGKPEDIAQAALYLLSDNSSWMTGQIMHIDGGMSSLRPV